MLCGKMIEKATEEPGKLLVDFSGTDAPKATPLSSSNSNKLQIYSDDDWDSHDSQDSEGDSEDSDDVTPQQELPQHRGSSTAQRAQSLPCILCFLFLPAHTVLSMSMEQLAQQHEPSSSTPTPMSLAVSWYTMYRQALAGLEWSFIVTKACNEQPSTLWATVKRTKGLHGLDVALTNIDGVPVVGGIAKLYFLYVHILRSDLIGATLALWCKLCVNRSVMGYCCTGSSPTAQSPEAFDTNINFLDGRHDFYAEGRTAASTLSPPLPPAAQNPDFGEIRGDPGSEADQTLPGVAKGAGDDAPQIWGQLGACSQSYAVLSISGPWINLFWWPLKG
jgi:hypothetical protein